ncbi:MAG: 6-pyruvoyl trahydropterin synthase family protein [Candidatus Hodarchaeales archaeon]|jgi:6-pyruvoyltetrahydropterin/6-carboxytetrahydropterin synthase
MSTLEQIYSRSNNYFSACHFLVGFSKCDRLHGHDYSVKLRLTYHSDVLERFYDFRTINLWLNQIIDEIDHKILLPGNSKQLKILPTRNGENWGVYIQEKKYSFPQKDVEILKSVKQTTCENLAQYLHTRIAKKLKETDNYTLVSALTLILSETEGNEVSYSANVF